ENSEALTVIAHLIDHSHLDEAASLITSELTRATPAVSVLRRHSQEWFDSACYIARHMVHQSRILACLRSDQLTLYGRLRKYYKALLADKKRTFEVRRERRLVEEAEVTPHTFLRKPPCLSHP